MQVGTSCCYTDSITEAKKKGRKVTLIGFGTFSVAERKARKGRNPQAGKEIKIAAKKIPKFSTGSALKAEDNGVRSCITTIPVICFAYGPSFTD